MRIVVATNLFYYGSHELNCSYYFFVETLKKMGHEVHVFDFGTLNAAGTNRLVARVLYDYVYALRPDIFFDVPCRNEIPRWALQNIKSYSRSVTVAWNSDDDRRWDDYSRHLAPLFDVMVTTYAHIYERAHRQGHTHVRLSQWAANLEYNKILTLEKKYDVCFIGAAYGDRIDYVKRLIGEGFHVKVGGMGWDKHIDDALGTVSQTEMTIIHNQSRCIVVFSRGNEEQARYQIKGRVFEAPAYGVCTFVEDAPELGSFFEPDKEIVVFRSPDELVKKLCTYLADDARRYAVAMAGRKRVEREHTYEHRLEQLLSNIPEKKKYWFVCACGRCAFLLRLWYEEFLFSVKQRIKRILGRDIV